MEGVLPFSVTSVVEDILKQNGTPLSDIDLASRKAEEASLRRYEATGWLRRTVGVVGGKDLPAEPSEEDFRMGLRSGIILCNVLNKIQPGAVPKVVEGPCDSVNVPDGAALVAYQYFENVRNFLVAIEELGLPTFEASDLEKGGKTSRIVNCVLALKSYGDWKQGGSNGSWKFGPNSKPPSGKQFVRKNSEPFMNSFSRTSSMCDSEKSLDSVSDEQFSSCDLVHDLNDTNASHSLNLLVRTVLMNKKQEDIPKIVESLLGKVMQEFEHRVANKNEPVTEPPIDTAEGSTTDECLQEPATHDSKVEDRTCTRIVDEDSCSERNTQYEGSNSQLLKWKMMSEQQYKDVVELKHTLHTTKAGIQFLQMKHEQEFNNLGRQLHALANAATGYRRVLEENRKLYNQVQDLKGSIRVYCRVRPFLPGQPNGLSSVDHLEEGKISIYTPSKTGKEARRSFKFNKVFGPSATQEEVFSDTQPLIRSVLDGYNVCIFAYGQTGSGKTFTMSGPKELTEQSVGVNYRALGDLFQLSEERKDTFAYSISVQMIEIYNEQVRDLLSTDGANKRLEIRNSSQNGINVPDANIVPVSSTSDVISLMSLGQKNRAVSATALNDRSSRSHSCLTVHVQGKDLTSGATLHGSMHLVDLAGSERVDKSEVIGDQLKEAQHINKSLSALGDVIASLAQKNLHVPYRNSKLTQLLQDSLGGQAKTLMFVHISPEPDALGETISTLKFAERVSMVELGAARVNKDSSDIKELKEQVASLKAALARKDGELGKLSYSRSSTPERLPLASGKQTIDDELWQNSSAKPKRQSFDLHDLMKTSKTWEPVGDPALKEQRERKPGKWVDKVMLNKHENGQCEEDRRQLPEMFYQRHIPDPSKIYQQNSKRIPAIKKDGQDASRYETFSDDSGDFEAATSDSSETDLLYQLNVSKVSNTPNGLKSKTKRTPPKSAKTPEMRSLIPARLPSPSRKLPNGLSPPLHRGGRQPVTVDTRRKTHAK